MGSRDNREIRVKDIPLHLCKGVYQPSEDTYFFIDILNKKRINSPYPSIIMDMGTGTGVLAVAAAKKYPDAVIFVVDINEDAVECAARNLRANNVKYYQAVHSDLFSNLKADLKGKIDLVLFNPPYLIGDDSSISTEQLAWNGGKAGAIIINRFLNEVNKYLTTAGKILILVEYRNLSAIKLVDQQEIAGVVSTTIPGEKLFILEISN